jgi:hypothetical protein
MRPERRWTSAIRSPSGFDGIDSPSVYTNRNVGSWVSKNASSDSHQPRQHRAARPSRGHVRSGGAGGLGAVGVWIGARIRAGASAPGAQAPLRRTRVAWARRRPGARGRRPRRCARAGRKPCGSEDGNRTRGRWPSTANTGSRAWASRRLCSAATRRLTGCSPGRSRWCRRTALPVGVDERDIASLVGRVPHEQNTPTPFSQSRREIDDLA